MHIPIDTLLSDIYESCKDKDEFLYIAYSELEAYGLNNCYQN